MTKGFHKKASKRVSCRKRYKIEKKVREHNRKLRKNSKKNGNKKPKHKDPGVPANLPFKDEVIREAQEARERETERKRLLREEFKRRQQDGRDKKLEKRRAQSLTVAQLAKDAEQRAKEFVEGQAQGTSSGQLAGVSNVGSYYKEFQKVVEEADILLEVIDARDPLGTRCREVEEAVLSAGTDKKLVILLNKVDLVPHDNLMSWLEYLRNEFPTIAFKASTQSQNSKLGRSSLSIMSANEDALQSSKCFGAKALMKLLGNYCLNQGVKSAIKVGVVGFPNVGKSSVINSLKRSRACGVGATPGLTKTAQEVSLDKHIKLLDSPGIVFAKVSQFGDFSDKDEASRFVTSLIALRNATKIETLQDPTAPIEALLTRVKKEDLMVFYKLPDFSSPEEFLELVARRFGKLKKGGIADVNSAARKVLTDWNSGKFRYYSVPPEKHSTPSHIGAEIIQNLTKPFELDNALITEEMQWTES